MEYFLALEHHQLLEGHKGLNYLCGLLGEVDLFLALELLLKVVLQLLDEQSLFFNFLVAVALLRKHRLAGGRLFDRLVWF